MKVEKLSVPVDDRPKMEWGSDAMAEVLNQLKLPYIALTPGASYRGLHDSLVNYLGNTKPGIVLCLHEEHAVAIAQGYAKVTGEPMAVALHSNVGLMHATMAIFNAFCDRMPMLIVGATGPLDAAKRRPWIDWLHTTADQASLIRNYCKWDDQPGSVEASLESFIRADMLTRSYPQAPTYVCLDAELQELKLDEPIRIPPIEKFLPPASPAPSAILVDQILGMINDAERPIVLMGRVGRSQKQWDERVQMIEQLGAIVLSDLKNGTVFPTRHPLQPAWPGSRMTPEGRALIRQADVILSLDWIDLGGTLTSAGVTADQKVISCTNDYALHNGWGKEHYALPAVDLSVAADPDMLVEALLAKSIDTEPKVRVNWPADVIAIAKESGEPEAGQLLMSQLAAGLKVALNGDKVTWTGLPLGWSRGDIDFDGPLDYLGTNGGGGVGAGPGIAVGAALALAGTGRIPVAIIGDGDYLMCSSALWTAVHHRLPLLVVVANNRSYYNDEAHQQRVAITRGRPAENCWVGQHLRDPDPDLATIARGHGLIGYGPIKTSDELDEALTSAVAEVKDGKAVVVDVWVSPRGYQGAP